MNHVDVLTFAGLSKKIIELFWPTLHKQYGFGKDTFPVFLTHETTQYFMAKATKPLMADGMFDSVTINRNRIFSQLIDNLNKAALNGLNHGVIFERLKLASVGDAGQSQLYQDVQRAIINFREYCLKNNLVDFSLQIEMLASEAQKDTGSICEYLLSTYKHLIYDNSEEDAFVVHEFVKDLLPKLDNSIVIFDHDAGIREFLGASPDSAYTLKDQCEDIRVFNGANKFYGEKSGLTKALDSALGSKATQVGDGVNLRQGAEVIDSRFFPEMIEATTDRVETLVSKLNVPPEQIAVLAPFLPDSLRYALSSRLEKAKIPWVSNRPSRSIIEEPISKSLIALSCISHPSWGMVPTLDEIVHMLSLLIPGLDIIRAQLLAEHAYRSKGGGFPSLLPFDSLSVNVKTRVTGNLGEKYEGLRSYIQDYVNKPPLRLDAFISEIFVQLLSRSGFGFASDLENGRVAGNFVESARKFRLVVELMGIEQISAAKEFILMLKEEIVQAQYFENWQQISRSALLIAPAHTFLMLNRVVDFQFWLDIGSSAWHTRIHQPLTHPYVLSQGWSTDRFWTDQDEHRENRSHLRKIVLGLARRANEKVFLMSSQLSENGYENQGLLWEMANVMSRQKNDAAQS
ncbi:MAG: hypothetical protein KIS88_02250 [Anaerolineales bacterium]|nr:hypothetical protein [Anaerolineales bacterium]